MTAPRVGRTLNRPLSPLRVAGASLVMGLLLVGVGSAALLLGTAEITWTQILGLMSGSTEVSEATRLIVLEIRLPRILLAGLVGYALASGGVVFQALLRNPLADPFILGVSSGSAFGAILGISLGLGFHLGVPLLSFAGALATVLLLIVIGARRMGVESSTILLTGVIINAFFTALIMFLISIAADARLHSMLFWLYGDLSQSEYRQAALIAPVILLATLVQ